MKRGGGIALLQALVTVMLIAGTAAAKESDFEKRKAHGIAAMEAGDYAAAAEDFRAAVAERADDQDVVLYLGIALSRAGSPEAGPYLKRALAADPSNPRVNLELGAFHLAAGDVTEGLDYLRDTLRLDPGGELAARAQELLQEPEDQGDERRWSVRFMTGGQYDTNVVLVGNNSPLPRGISRQGDWRGLFNLRLEGTAYKSDAVELTAAYGFYQSLHVRLDEFNISQHLVEAEGKVHVSSNVVIKVGGATEYLLLGGERYDLSATAGAGAVVTEADRASTTAEYRYRESRFRNSDLFPDNWFRNGDNNLVALTQTFPLPGGVTGRVGGSWEREDALKNFWSFTGLRGFAGMAIPLPGQSLLDLFGEYYRRNYRGDNPISGDRRIDNTWTGAATVTKLLGENFAVTAGWYFTHNDSTVREYTYDRGIASLFLTARYP